MAHIYLSEQNTPNPLPKSSPPSKTEEQTETSSKRPGSALDNPSHLSALPKELLKAIFDKLYLLSHTPVHLPGCIYNTYPFLRENYEETRCMVNCPLEWEGFNFVPPPSSGLQTALPGFGLTVQRRDMLFPFSCTAVSTLWKAIVESEPRYWTRIVVLYGLADLQTFGLDAALTIMQAPGQTFTSRTLDSHRSLASQLAFSKDQPFELHIVRCWPSYSFAVDVQSVPSGNEDIIRRLNLENVEAQFIRHMSRTLAPYLPRCTGLSFNVEHYRSLPRICDFSYDQNGLRTLSKLRLQILPVEENHRRMADALWLRRRPPSLTSLPENPPTLLTTLSLSGPDFVDLARNCPKWLNAVTTLEVNDYNGDWNRFSMFELSRAFRSMPYTLGPISMKFSNIHFDCTSQLAGIWPPPLSRASLAVMGAPEDESITFPLFKLSVCSCPPEFLKSLINEAPFRWGSGTLILHECSIPTTGLCLPPVGHLVISSVNFPGGTQESAGTSADGGLVALLKQMETPELTLIDMPSFTDDVMVKSLILPSAKRYEVVKMRIVRCPKLTDSELRYLIQSRLERAMFDVMNSGLGPGCNGSQDQESLLHFDNHWQPAIVTVGEPDASRSPYLKPQRSIAFELLDVSESGVQLSDSFASWLNENVPARKVEEYQRHFKAQRLRDQQSRS